MPVHVRTSRASWVELLTRLPRTSKWIDIPNARQYSARRRADDSTRSRATRTCCLFATLAFSAVTAGVSMALNFPHWADHAARLFRLALRRTKTRATAGRVSRVVRAHGASWGSPKPLLNAYLSIYANGAELVMTALGTTAITFLGLSALCGPLGARLQLPGRVPSIGIIAPFVLGLVAYFFQLPTLSLVVSGMFVVAMAGFILFLRLKQPPAKRGRSTSWRRSRSPREHLQPVHEPAPLARLRLRRRLTNGCWPTTAGSLARARTARCPAAPFFFWPVCQ